MACQIFKRLTFRTNTCLKRASNSYCHNSVSFSTQNARRKSLLTHKLPALTLATLMTIKLPPVLSTVHNTEFCSSYSSSCGSGVNDPTDPQRTSSRAQDMESSPSQDQKQTLSPLQYHVTQEAGTERAFTGKYYDHWEPGVYTCVVCGADLFGSEAKYNSGSGWPSFHSPYSSPAADRSGGRHNVVTVRDKSHGMVRDEVRCKKCGGHLGHVFDDGPPPSGLRYCINSAALDFKGKEQ